MCLLRGDALHCGVVRVLVGVVADDQGRRGEGVNDLLEVRTCAEPRCICRVVDGPCRASDPPLGLRRPFSRRRRTSGAGGGRGGCEGALEMLRYSRNEGTG
jgi:hypothetical protein